MFIGNKRQPLRESGVKMGTSSLSCRSVFCLSPFSSQSDIDQSRDFDSLCIDQSFLVPRQRKGKRLVRTTVEHYFEFYIAVTLLYPLNSEKLTHANFPPF